jgi:HK97 family phage portal protein
VVRTDNRRDRVPASRIFALLDRSDDPWCPRSRIARAAEPLGVAMAGQAFAANLFRNGAKLSGVLQYPGILNEEAQKNLQDSFEKHYTGTSKAGRVLLLEEGAKWQPASMTAEDAQTIEARKFSVEEIARIFRVPPPLIQDLSHATYSNITELHRSFATLTLAPRCNRWEAAIERQLLTPAERASGLYVELNLDALVRGDLKTRFESYQLGIQNGILSANECRERENLNARDGGDSYLTPLNFAVDGKAPEQPSQQRQVEIHSHDAFGKPRVIRGTVSS